MLLRAVQTRLLFYRTAVYWKRKDGSLVNLLTVALSVPYILIRQRIYELRQNFIANYCFGQIFTIVCKPSQSYSGGLLNTRNLGVKKLEKLDF